MDTNKLKEELIQLWVDYLNFVDGACEEKVRNMIESEIELYHIRGVERQINALITNMVDMNDDIEIHNMFFDRFDKYLSMLSELKNYYERK